MTLALNGLAKLNEECGELIQVIGKTLAWYMTDEPHWDGSVLKERLIEEMGDVRAAIEMASSLQGIHAEVTARYMEKHRVLCDWHMERDNNAMGVDAAVMLATRRMERDDKIRQAADAVLRFESTGGTMLSSALTALRKAMEETP